MSTMEAYRAERSAYLRGLAHNIRRLREARGLTQTELYKRASLHRTEIGKIEGAEVEPRLMTLVIIADTLQVTLQELVEGLPVPKERRPPPTPKRVRASTG